MIETGFHRNWARMPIDHKDPSLVLYLPLWYPYSDMSGSTIYSYDRARISCTVTGATWGRYGRTFAGGDDYITFTQSALDFGASDFTVVGWVKRSAVGALRTVICHGADSATGFRWRYTGLDTWLLATSQASAIQTSEGSTALVPGVWTQVGAVRVGAGVTMYFNAAVDTLSVVGTHINPTNVAGASYIGLYSDLISDPWYGDIGEVLVYNRAWTALEFLRYYQRTKGRYL